MSDKPLLADEFRHDPRIHQAKNLVLEALKDHQTKITGVSPPRTQLVQPYDEVLAAFNEIRGGKLYYPYLGSGLGKGALVELLDGSIKYDMISGIGVHYWGHSHPDIISRAFEGSLNDTVMQGHLQQNIDGFVLSKLLVEASGLDHCFLTSSGAMANENALKIAFQKKHPAHRILAFEKCFIGRSLALSQISDKPAFREGLPPNVEVDYVPFYHPEQGDKSIEQSVHILKQHLHRYPKQHAVFCFEMVQGEGGFHTGTTDFFKALMDICREHHIAIFVDEVQTFGRTPKLFAFQHFQLEEYVDIASVGKLSQVCATLFRQDFKPKPGLLSQTFTACTVAIHVGRFIIDALMNGSYYGPKGKIEQVHDQFIAHFSKLEKKYPDVIQGPYGIGAMIAFTPFKGDHLKAAQFAQDLYHAGVISFIAGAHPTRIRFLPPIGAITSADIDSVMSIVEATIRNML